MHRDKVTDLQAYKAFGGTITRHNKVHNVTPNCTEVVRSPKFPDLKITEVIKRIRRTLLPCRQMQQGDKGKVTRLPHRAIQHSYNRKIIYYRGEGRREKGLKK